MPSHHVDLDTQIATALRVVKCMFVAAAFAVRGAWSSELKAKDSEASQRSARKREVPRYPVATLLLPRHHPSAIRPQRKRRTALSPARRRSELRRPPSKGPCRAALASRPCSSSLSRPSCLNMMTTMKTTAWRQMAGPPGHREAVSRRWRSARAALLTVGTHQALAPCVPCHAYSQCRTCRCRQR